MKKVHMGLVALSVSVLLVSCSNNNETIETSEVMTKQVSEKIIAAAQAANLNADYLRYGDFYFPDGTKEERLFVEEDIVMTEEKLFQMAEDAQADPTSRQYSTNNLVAQGKNISIIGFTGGSQALSTKAKRGLRRAVRNYNNLNLSIKFTLTFGTNWQSKDMVVYDTSNSNNGSGGVAGFPSGGNPYKFVQIYNLNGFSTNVNEHVITHEIGHSVGFRHTDYFSRQSCGQNVNEGSAGVGANHITGTPTGYDSTSVMLACFNSGVSGNFNNNDKNALRVLY